MNPEPPPMNTTLHTNLPTLCEYYDQLAKHDWDYDYSDDGHTWRAGSANEKRLLKIALHGGRAYRQLFNAWAEYSTAPMKRPFPERP